MKFKYLPAFDADQVIMVVLMFNFESRSTVPEIIREHQVEIDQLLQCSIDCREGDFSI